MKIQKFIILTLLPIIAGCGHRPDNALLTDAHNDYQLISKKYTNVVDAMNKGDEKVITETMRQVGLDRHTSVKESFWSLSWHPNFQTTPLHYTVYFARKDADLLAKHTKKLEKRMLSDATICNRLHELHDLLLSAIQIVQSQNKYIKESQFLQLAQHQPPQLIVIR